jgi:hypothetical protein
MKYTIKKIFDNENHVIGYETEGLKKVLRINIYVGESIAKSIFDELLKMKDIPEVIEGLANVKLYAKSVEGKTVIILPDKEGRYPWDDGCDNIFKQQTKES